jgi:hypothetical protein
VSEGAEAKPESIRAYLALAASAIGFALGYALPIYARLPSLFYDPLARRFIFGPKPGPLPMGYLGQIGWGLVGALAVGGATHVLSRAKKTISDQSLLLAAAWVLTALILVGAYFTWNNWP